MPLPDSTYLFFLIELSFGFIQSYFVLSVDAQNKNQMTGFIRVIKLFSSNKPCLIVLYKIVSIFGNDLSTFQGLLVCVQNFVPNSGPRAPLCHIRYLYCLSWLLDISLLMSSSCLHQWWSLELNFLTVPRVVLNTWLFILRIYLLSCF